MRQVISKMGIHRSEVLHANINKSTCPSLPLDMLAERKKRNGLLLGKAVGKICMLDSKKQSINPRRNNRTPCIAYFVVAFDVAKRIGDFEIVFFHDVRLQRYISKA